MRFAVLLVICALASASAVAQQRNLCELQLREFVQKELGQTIVDVRIDWTFSISEDAAEEPSPAIVRTKECPGFHSFELLGNFQTCVDQVYYGAPPNRVVYQGGRNGC